MNLLIDSCFQSAVPLLSRGWIVPVGGSTPDLLKDRPTQGIVSRNGAAIKFSESGAFRAEVVA